MTKHKLKQFTSPATHGGAYYDLDLIFRDTCDLVRDATLLSLHYCNIWSGIAVFQGGAHYYGVAV